ncbi:hypothetical protein ACE7GA_16175 [Roseomonas sp. CCTCC AB2023176]|uniref:hypothetical protein n=1 Tax=Roseomonas sp. CCTCC AB2023176 TaxID=3342640 RepID=UPI0035DA9239
MLTGPANVPAPTLSRLSGSAGAAVMRPDVAARHRARGAEVTRTTPEATRAFVPAEIEKWGEAALRAGIRPQAAG